MSQNPATPRTGEPLLVEGVPSPTFPKLADRVTAARNLLPASAMSDAVWDALTDIPVDIRTLALAVEQVADDLSTHALSLAVQDRTSESEHILGFARALRSTISGKTVGGVR